MKQKKHKQIIINNNSNKVKQTENEQNKQM